MCIVSCVVRRIAYVYVSVFIRCEISNVVMSIVIRNVIAPCFCTAIGSLSSTFCGCYAWVTYNGCAEDHAKFCCPTLETLADISYDILPIRQQQHIPSVLTKIRQQISLIIIVCYHFPPSPIVSSCPLFRL